VYSTCTIEPDENSEICYTSFLFENPGFVLESAKSIIDDKLVYEEGFVQAFPNIHGIDGHFRRKLREYIRERTWLTSFYVLLRMN
jgi:16S rRNA C967 or C1407 C5-methylase (RsmB/RsmF family)